MSTSSINVASQPEDFVNKLATIVGENWAAISNSKTEAQKHAAKLSQIILDLKPPSNTSVISYGSLAREEWTEKSDVDWTLMIDGPADMDHFDFAKSVGEAFAEAGYPKPGQTGTFGSMSSSYELVHYIGGIEDTNQNITRRILVLLESVALSNTIIHERVVRAVLRRYILGDPPTTKSTEFHIPLFLFNDVVRYWRTMAVDYATKKWQRSNKGWALKNIKLRMSRKLLFVKGMLVCFLCDRYFSGSPKGKQQELVEAELLQICFALCRRTAVDLLAENLLKFAKPEIGRKVFSAYNRFLETLDDAGKREKLERLEFEEAEDALFKEQRRNTREFQEGVDELFFDSNDKLAELTRGYGVF